MFLISLFTPMPKISSPSTSGDTGRKAYPLRVESSLFDAVRERALAEGRSVNRQIEHLLKLALDTPSAPGTRSPKSKTQD